MTNTLRLLLFILMMALALIIAGFALSQLQHPAVIIEWSTASELDIVGFNLYRSADPQAEPIKINPELIPPADDPLVGGEYKYEDRQVTPGVTYSYWLEDLSASGAAERTGPTEVKAVTSGWLELALAVGLLGLSGLGVYRTWREIGRERQAALQRGTDEPAAG